MESMVRMAPAFFIAVNCTHMGTKITAFIRVICVGPGLREAMVNQLADLRQSVRFHSRVVELRLKGSLEILFFDPA